MIDLRRNNIEAGMKQWMGCIYAGQRRVDVALQRIVEDEGRACRHVAGKTGKDRKRFLADTSQTKGSYGEALLHVLLVLKAEMIALDCSYFVRGK
jgi:hypothetical protein